jgi:ribose transport system substrate-binding protein
MLRSSLLRVSIVCSVLVLTLAASLGTGASLASGTHKKAQALQPVNPSTVPLKKESGVEKFVLAKPGSGKGLKLGYISLGDQVPFVHLVSVGIKQQAKRSGATLVFCDSREQTSITLDCVKTLKTEGVQAYLNFQSDSKSSPSICAAGPQVPVIAIDIHQPPCETAFMGANNSYAGYVGGTAMGLFFKKNFNCKYDSFVSMEDFAVGVVNDLRMGGYRTGFSKICGKIHGLRKENTGRIDIARTTFTDVLTALTGQHRIIVVGINDDVIEGALAAARTAGRANDIYYSGQGADPSAWCEIKKNVHWVGDAAYFPERYGEIGIPNLIKLAKGQSVPKMLLVPHHLINKLNIDSIYHPTCK